MILVIKNKLDVLDFMIDSCYIAIYLKVKKLEIQNEHIYTRLISEKFLESCTKCITIKGIIIVSWFRGKHFHLQILLIKIIISTKRLFKLRTNIKLNISFIDTHIF